MTIWQCDNDKGILEISPLESEKNDSLIFH